MRQGVEPEIDGSLASQLGPNPKTEPETGSSHGLPDVSHDQNLDDTQTRHDLHTFQPCKEVSRAAASSNFPGKTSAVPMQKGIEESKLEVWGNVKATRPDMMFVPTDYSYYRFTALWFQNVSAQDIRSSHNNDRLGNLHILRRARDATST